MQADGRFPVYVILTTRRGLERQYGSEMLPAIDKAMQRVVDAIAARNDWSGVLIYADDAVSMGAFSLKPAQFDDPWSLKLGLADLDASLKKQGEMIGAVLIVGGPEIVPFHHLPNPVDDADIDIPSDNPYATRDENYFVPEWPVGRLPGGKGQDAEPLINALRQISERHRRAVQAKPWRHRMLVRLRDWFIFHRARPSWGYTAAIWRRASLSVFRPIGQPNALLVSPPVHVDPESGRRRRIRKLPKARLGYFNLHGLEDSNEWYGQKDPNESSKIPDYPVALRPQDIVNGGRAPEVVFSEACYGAHILNKTVEEAMALKFLVSGTQAVVGSTTTAYGSITTPLIAGDLLGNAFWKYLREGLPAGEALRRAKIHLAREMQRRQGYLDGEDQKTLISFVLYGDPLSSIREIGPRTKSILRPLKPPASIKTVCDRDCQAMQANLGKVGSTETASDTGTHRIPDETLAQVKKVLEKYLPGMVDAEIIYTYERASCAGKGHTCPTSSLGRKTTPDWLPERSVVTFAKQIIQTAGSEGQNDNGNSTEAEGNGKDRAIHHVHRHFARLTLDGEGKVVKMAVSR
jgi:hypothetical protein